MTIFGEILTITELRNWILLVFATAGAFITIRTYLNSTRQRKIDNTFKTLDFLRRHIGDKEINSFVELFQTNNEIAGAKYNEFLFADGRVDYVESMFSEGGRGNGDIHNMIELFNLVSPTLKDLEMDIIWYEYGQVMGKIYQWTEYLEKNNIPNNYDDKYPRFYENFNQYMKKVNNRMSHKPIKYYTYAE